MSTVTRRRIARIALAVDIACGLAVAIRASLPGYHSWLLGFTSFATILLGVAGSLAYLRSTNRRSS